MLMLYRPAPTATFRTMLTQLTRQASFNQVKLTLISHHPNKWLEKMNLDFSKVREK